MAEKVITAYIENENCWWWLRSPGEEQIKAAFVYDNGYINREGINLSYSRNCVRPVMWLKL